MTVKTVPHSTFVYIAKNAYRSLMMSGNYNAVPVVNGVSFAVYVDCSNSIVNVTHTAGLVAKSFPFRASWLQG